MKVCHIITGLGIGGAEMMLYKLLGKMNHDRFPSEVVSLTTTGRIGEKIRELGIPVHELTMHRDTYNVNSLFKLGKILRKIKPDIVQTWMNHANFFGGIAAKIFTNSAIVWNIRQSNFEPKLNKPGTILVVQASAHLSTMIPQAIVCCSYATERVCAQMNYDPARMLVIPNGFNLSQFSPDPGARTDVRGEIGIAQEQLVIGLIGRFDPQKDHLNFFKAAKMVIDQIPNICLLLCGDEITLENPSIRKWINECGIAKKVHLLGLRHDIPRLLAGLDIACSSSCGEGFPNVVGEAMACGVPCVVTDVGDSARIVGETGFVVPPRDPNALAQALVKMVSLAPEERQALGKIARTRIEAHYSLDFSVGKYEMLYNTVP